MYRSFWLFRAVVSVYSFDSSLRTYHRMVVWSLLLAADTEVTGHIASQPLTLEEHHLQNVLLQRAFETMDEGYVARIPFADFPYENYSRIEDVGHLFTLVFHDRSYLEQFRMQWVLDGNVQIDFLPPTIEILEMTHSLQSFTLHMRNLPRNVRQINFRGTKITGTVRFADVPANVVHLNLASNLLSGRLHLDPLPPLLENLSVECNSFSNRVVYYGILPAKIVCIKLLEEGSTSTLYVRPIAPEMKIKSRSWVFQRRVGWNGKLAHP